MMTEKFDSDIHYVIDSGDSNSDGVTVDREAWDEMRTDFVTGWQKTSHAADLPALTADSPSFLVPVLTLGEVYEMSKRLTDEQ